MTPFGSQDHIESAVDSLQAGPFPFLLISGTAGDRIRLDSALNAENRELVMGWVKSGHLEQILKEHFDRNPIGPMHPPEPPEDYP
jgi:hypothetical protein